LQRQRAGGLAWAKEAVESAKWLVAAMCFCVLKAKLWQQAAFVQRQLFFRKECGSVREKRLLLCFKRTCKYFYKKVS
jgi:hypothetical protein